ncbi:hypothetical protein B2J88_05555 [Rhodococcus sp. SRB_17]|nr:hypothetical protein [Rhodococcus sp. SRB_17]
MLQIRIVRIAGALDPPRRSVKTPIASRDHDHLVAGCEPGYAARRAAVGELMYRFSCVERIASVGQTCVVE